MTYSEQMFTPDDAAPATPGRGRDAKAMLRRHEPDPEWAIDLADMRALLDTRDRSVAAPPDADA